MLFLTFICYECFGLVIYKLWQKVKPTNIIEVEDRRFKISLAAWIFPLIYLGFHKAYKFLWDYVK